MGGRDLWMSFLVEENLNDANQFILGRDIVRNFDVMIDLYNGLIRIVNRFVLLPNPNSQNSVILGRSFSVTRKGLCVSVLMNTMDTTVSIQRGKKLGYALPMRTDYEETQNLKKYSVKDCPYHANKDKILKAGLFSTESK